MTQQKALILGATGLVGSHLLTLLLQDQRYSSVTALLRKPLSVNHEKLKQVIVNFDQLSEFQAEFNDHQIFVCLGTTIKKAGSQQAFRKVDFELVLQAAKMAQQANSEKFVWISSIGADAKSGSFYLQTKGELELEIKRLGLTKAVAVRPSLLLGTREEFRLGETVGIKFYQLVSPLLKLLLPESFNKYLPIEALQVAKGMLALANNQAQPTNMEVNTF